MGQKAPPSGLDLNLPITEACYTLLEEMVLFRTRNGSIPRFIWNSKMVLYRTIFLVKGSIGQAWNPRVLYRTQRNPFLRVYRTF